MHFDDEENVMYIDDQELVGKTISKIEVDGFGVLIVCTDGITFSYGASDGGYSSWGTYLPLLNENKGQMRMNNWRDDKVTDKQLGIHS